MWYLPRLQITELKCPSQNNRDGHQPFLLHDPVAAACFRKSPLKIKCWLMKEENITSDKKENSMVII